MVERNKYNSINENYNAIVSSKEQVLKMLQELGVRKGMTILVQADLTKLGYLIGEEQMLIDALIESVGYEGTIVMPAFTMHLCDPANKKERVARFHWGNVRKNALPFDRKKSIPKNQDTLVQQFLHNEGVLRSYHPLYSFAAWGKYAKLICDKHPLHFGLNADSPLGKLEELNAFVVMLGCPMEESVALSLAHYKNNLLPIKVIYAPIENNRKLQWKAMLDLDLKDVDYHNCCKAMEDRKVIRHAYLGGGKCTLFSMREGVRQAQECYCIENDEVNMWTNSVK
jgi:aminoglycoside 3-N-acetyltransferase